MDGCSCLVQPSEKNRIKSEIIKSSRRETNFSWVEIVRNDYGNFFNIWEILGTNPCSQMGRCKRRDGLRYVLIT